MREDHRNCPIRSASSSGHSRKQTARRSLSQATPMTRHMHLNITLLSSPLGSTEDTGDLVNFVSITVAHYLSSIDRANETRYCASLVDEQAYEKASWVLLNSSMRQRQSHFSMQISHRIIFLESDGIRMIQCVITYAALVPLPVARRV